MNHKIKTIINNIDDVQERTSRFHDLSVSAINRKYFSLGKEYLEISSNELLHQIKKYYNLYEKKPEENKDWTEKISSLLFSLEKIMDTKVQIGMVSHDLIYSNDVLNEWMEYADVFSSSDLINQLFSLESDFEWDHNIIQRLIEIINNEKEENRIQYFAILADHISKKGKWE